MCPTHMLLKGPHSRELKTPLLRCLTDMVHRNTMGQKGSNTTKLSSQVPVLAPRHSRFEITSMHMLGKVFGMRNTWTVNCLVAF